MKRHLNTLFVTTQGAYLCREGEAVLVKNHGELIMRVPSLTIGGIVCFGRVAVSSPLLDLCARRGVTISFHSVNGRFLARVEGPVSGNVLLRREQYRRADDPTSALELSRGFVLAKILNSRAILLRGIRDHGDWDSRLSNAVDRLARCAREARSVAGLSQLRGTEGDAGRTYFQAFGALITRNDDEFTFPGRNRRPPLDPTNALLSFLYSILYHDVRSACESVGLDPQVGFFHRDRPGRSGLALDLVEELRAYMADRVAVSLINRKQLDGQDFSRSPTGGVKMVEKARKLVLVSYQRRKQEEIIHPFIKERTTVGLIPHLQARLFARHLRGDIDRYPPFLVK